MSEDNNKSIDKRLGEIKKNFVNNKSSEKKLYAHLQEFVPLIFWFLLFYFFYYFTTKHLVLIL